MFATNTLAYMTGKGFLHCNDLLLTLIARGLLKTMTKCFPYTALYGMVPVTYIRGFRKGLSLEKNKNLYKTLSLRMLHYFRYVDEYLSA